MKKTGMSIFCICIFFMCGCSNNQYVPTIDLKKNIAVVNNAELSDVIDSLKVIELKSDSVFIKDIIIFGEIEHKLYGYSSGGDIFIFTDNGTLLKYFNHTGRGPCEYLFIWGAKLDQSDKQIIIHDYRNKFLKYSLNGDFLEEVSNDLIKNIADIASTDSGYYVATVASSHKKSNNIVVFDKQYNILNTFFPVSDISQTNSSGMTILESVTLSGARVIYKSNSNDTVYSITSTNPTPVLVVKQDDLQMPPEVMITVGEKADKEKSKYIDNFYGKFAGNYYLASYRFNNQTYYDLWDISHTPQNIIHQNLNKDLYAKGAKEGFKISVNNQILYAWPRYIQDNILYCVLDYSYFHKSVAESDENKNPVVLKIWLKHRGIVLNPG